MIKGIIFDFDGVLVDTELATFNYYKEVLPEYGIHLKDGDFKYKIGRKSVDFFRDVMGDKFDPSFVEKITKQKRDAFFNNVSKYVTLIPGEIETLQFCKDKGLKIALGSQNERFFIDKVLEDFNMTEYFDATVSLQDISNKKPDPEIFLKAAKLIGITPDQGIVVEDAPEGIAAAKGGGFYAIGITSSHGNDVLKDADVIFSAVREIQKPDNQFVFGQ